MAEINVLSEVNGSVWKILVKVGDSVEEDQPLAYVESMKMEIPVMASSSGVIAEVFVVEGQQVSEGAPILSIRE